MENITLKKENAAIDGTPAISFTVEGVTTREALNDVLLQIREFGESAFADHAHKEANNKQTGNSWAEKIATMKKKQAEKLSTHRSEETYKDRDIITPKSLENR